MAEFVQLSAQSLCYLGDIKGYLPFEKPGDSLLSLDDLLGFIHYNKSRQSQQYLYESLQTALLADLLRFVLKGERSPNLARKKTRLRDYLTFLSLFIAGVWFFGCEGFASVSAIFVVFSISGLMIFSISMVFLVVSIVVFFGFQLLALGVALDSLQRAGRYYQRAADKPWLQGLKFYSATSNHRTH